MPPRSTKAPKSVMFLTWPSRTWSFASSWMISLFCFARCSSSTARRETTMFRRRLFSLMILNSIDWLRRRVDVLHLPERDLRTREEGLDAVQVDDHASLDLPHELRLPRPARPGRGRLDAVPDLDEVGACLERTTRPSWFSVFSRKTSISSPTFTPSRSGNSSTGITPSDLNPTSTVTSLSSILRTRPRTILPLPDLEGLFVELEPLAHGVRRLVFPVGDALALRRR